jgi:hypothetical protein
LAFRENIHIPPRSVAKRAGYRLGGLNPNPVGICPSRRIFLYQQGGAHQSILVTFCLLAHNFGSVVPYR